MIINEVSQKMRNVLAQIQINSNVEEIIQGLENLQNYSVLNDYTVQDLKEFILRLLELGIITLIRSEGCLIDDFKDIYLGETKYLNLLSFLDILEINQWSNYDVIKLTSRGKKIAATIIKAKIQEMDWQGIFDEYFFGLWLLNRLLPTGGVLRKNWERGYKYPGLQLYPVGFPPKDDIEMLTSFVRENIIWQETLKNLLDKLKENSLVFETFFYQTKGSKSMGDRYCIHKALAQKIDSIINSEFQECSTFFNKIISDFENKYWGLQFFDRLLFHGNSLGWKEGKIDPHEASSLLNEYYLKYYDSIVKLITIFQENFFINKNLNTKIPAMHIKSPTPFRTSFEEEYSKLIDQMGKIPFMEWKITHVPKPNVTPKPEKIKEPFKQKPISTSGLKENIIIGNNILPKQWGILGKANGVNVIIDLNAPHIIFVSGMMGSGKGYTIGVISEMLVSNSLENISEVEKKSTIIVLYKPRDDVASEFWSIKYANDNEKEIKALKEYNATPSNILSEEKFKIFLDPIVYEKQIEDFIEEYQTDKISALQINPSTLIPEDWANSLAIGGGSDALYIKEIFKILRHLDHPFSLNDIKNKINESKLEKRQKGLANSRLDILEEYFGPDDFIDDLIIGGVNIIDFRKSIYQPDDIFTIMTLIISKLQNKKELEREPFVFIVNEAHMYFKKGISKEFLSTIENLIRRKRHGANWLLLDTQLPTDVDEKIISLSDIKIIHFTDKTVNVPILNKTLGELKEVISELKTGECVIMSNESSIGLSKPIKVYIRPRITKHGAETKKAI